MGEGVQVVLGSGSHEAELMPERRSHGDREMRRDWTRDLRRAAPLSICEIPQAKAAGTCVLPLIVCAAGTSISSAACGRSWSWSGEHLPSGTSNPIRRCDGLCRSQGSVETLSAPLVVSFLELLRTQPAEMTMALWTSSISAVVASALGWPTGWSSGSSHRWLLSTAPQSHPWRSCRW
jgi:hypothetical protein